MTLPVNIDTTYPDTGMPSVKLHQQHHDLIHNHVNEHVNVKEFGAVGDRTHDDTQAIRDALTYIKSLRYSGTLYFPPGEYKVTSTITLSGGAHPRNHLLGGHQASGYLNGQRPPAVLIDGVTCAGPVFDLVDTGDTTFENLMVWAGHQALRMTDLANVNANNCSFHTEVSGVADNCAVFMLNCFWHRYHDCSFSSAGDAVPAIIMRGAAGPDIHTCGLIDFLNCTFWKNGIKFEQNVQPDLVAGITLTNVVMESSNGNALLHITEGAGLTAWHFGGLLITNSQQADSIAASPMVKVNATNCTLELPILSAVYGSGSNAIVVTAGAVLNPRIQSTIGSGSLTNVVDGSGNLLTVMLDKQVGMDFRGTEASATNTSLASSEGATLRFARSGDAYSRAGIASNGDIYWGPGGATSTGYDTKLYRNGANQLRTDDQFIITGPAAGDVPSVVQGFSGQTADLQEWQQNNGTLLSYVDANGRMGFVEQADPAAPAANRGVLYTRDNGSGKTQLCVRFNTGAVQVIATEP